MITLKGGFVVMFFAKTDKAITLIYHSEDHIGREILAYAQAEKLPIHDIDIAHTHVPGILWLELAEMMKIGIKDLINLEHPNFTQKFEGDYDLSIHGWLTILEHNPDTLRAPIVMKGDKIIMMSNPRDMLYFIEAA